MNKQNKENMYKSPYKIAWVVAIFTFTCAYPPLFFLFTYLFIFEKGGQEQ